MLINRLLKNLCSILPLLGFAAGTNGAEHGLVSHRIINKTTNFSEGESEYAATPYLPEIEVFHPVHFLTHPSQPKSVYIVQQNGIVLVVPDTEQPMKEIFLDIQSIVESEKADFGSPESGLLGMAFHPDYESNGRFFLFYTTEVENEHGETELRDELTEFRRSADDLFSALMDALNDPDNQLLKPGDSFHSVILQRIKSLSDIRMPPLGSNQQDVQAIKQMSRWIHTLGSERSFSEWWAGYGDGVAGQRGLADPYSAVNEDTDADGWTNWMEYKFDTDPLDKDSFWSPRLVLKDHATPRLEFVQPAGVAVWVERLENNADSQSELFWKPAPLPGNKITYPAYPVPRMFPLNLISDSEIYRVRVRVP